METATSFDNLFANCSSLKEVDISGWNTPSLTTAQKTFYNCSSLTSIDVSTWDTSGVQYAEAIFFNCRGVTAIDVSNWDTSSMYSMKDMFSGSGVYEVDAGNFTDDSFMSMVSMSSYIGMFENCPNLKKVDIHSLTYVDEYNSSSMFNGSPIAELILPDGLNFDLDNDLSVAPFSQTV